MRWRRFALVLAASGLCASCTGAGLDRSGGSEPPTVLVLANNDVSLDSAPAVGRFVQRLHELSDGRLTVEVRSSWGGGSDEAAVVQAVGSGQADLGWAGTRVMDKVGVDAFRPLQAPFLVSSYAAQAAVVADALADDLLAELRPVGLTGLALAADQLRFPAAAARPLLEPADFDRLVFRTAASHAQEDGLRALGARPRVSTRLPGQLEGFDAVETMWWTYVHNGQYNSAPFVTQNAALWPRTLTIFASTPSILRLTEQQRGWLAQAGQDASSWSVVHAQDRDANQVRRACEPVYAALRADARTAAVLARVETLVAAVTPTAPTEPPADCAYQPGEEQARAADVPVLSGPGDPGALPQGVYRFTVTRQHILDLGQSAEEADNNAGVITYTLRAGTWKYEQQPTVSSDRMTNLMTTCEGWYSVSGDTASFTTSTTYTTGNCSPPSWRAHWKAEGDRLVWSRLSVPDFALVFSDTPWERIGS